jgi:hypothetical protein
MQYLQQRRADGLAIDQERVLAYQQRYGVTESRT